MEGSGSWDTRIVAASYSTAAEGVVVELYGRTRENKSITVRVAGFEPYFYLVEPLASTINALESDPEVIRTEERVLLVDGKERSSLRVTIKYPWKVPEYRRKYGYDLKVLAADIPFAQRFIYDRDLGGCTTVAGRLSGKETAKRYTTELVVDADDFMECQPFKPELKVLSFDIENSIKTEEIYTICCAIGQGKEMSYENIVGSEREILQAFVDVVNKHDPDVITGYNVDGYDIPFIIERAKKLRLGELRVGRDGSQFSNIGSRFWRLHGRVISDAWWAVKKNLKPKKETLGHVAKMLLGEGKLEVNPLLIEKEWEEDSEKVVRYCQKDAELALRILDKLNILQRGMDLATVSKLPLDEALNSGSSTLIDSILIREADRNGIGVSLTHHRSGSKKIEGGYVHAIRPGVFHWVCVLDFKSMYPSLIISNNICFTTLDPKGEIKSPLGVRFLSKDARQGLIPKILEGLMRDRDEAKRMMKAAASDEERAYYDGLQNAIKVLMNSFYGVMASSFYRFTNKDIGASITAFARENTKGVIRSLEDQGYTVIYSDTDSIFFQPFPHETAKSRDYGTNLEEAIRFGKDVSRRFTEGAVVLEFEKILEPLFSHGKKKRYAGKIAWPEEGTIIRGYETRRTDSFDLQSQALLDVFDRILEDDSEGAIDLARGIIDKVRAGQAPVEGLVISRTCQEFNTYVTPDKLAWVQTAKKMEAKGYEFVPGMKVSWIVVDSGKTPQEVEPFIDGARFEHTPDWEYYARRIAATLSRATEVFGWDEKALLTGEKQQTLFGKGPGRRASRSKESTEPKRATKELKLDDFF